jgi:penicillin-binding protein 2
VPDPEWKEKALGEPWYSGDTVNMSIGQGFLLATPIQMANAYSAIAMGGLLRRPLLVTKVSDPQGRTVKEFRAEEIGRLPVSPTTLAAIQEGLRLVTQNPGGTTYGVFAGTGLDVVGKSGQAEDMAFGYDHVFFVAYGPRTQPAYLVLSALERGTSSARQAAPMVRDVFLGLLKGTPVSGR